MFFFISYIIVYCLLLHVQQCCHLLIGKVTNKIQRSLCSKEYYQEDRIKLAEYKKNGDKISLGHKPDLRTDPGKLGQMVILHYSCITSTINVMQQRPRLTLLLLKMFVFHTE